MTSLFRSRPIAPYSLTRRTYATDFGVIVEAVEVPDAIKHLEL